MVDGPERRNGLGSPFLPTHPAPTFALLQDGLTKIGRKAPAFTPGDRSYPKGYISPLARESQKFLRVLH